MGRSLYVLFMLIASAKAFIRRLTGSAVIARLDLNAVELAIAAFIVKAAACYAAANGLTSNFALTHFAVPPYLNIVAFVRLPHKNSFSGFKL